MLRRRAVPITVRASLFFRERRRPRKGPNSAGISRRRSTRLEALRIPGWVALAEHAETTRRSESCGIPDA